MRAFGFLLAASFFALLALPSRAGAPVPVDVELVLAVDISYSMDFDELALQREGYITALTSKDFVDAIRNGPHGKIALIYIEWAGSHEQTIVVPWTLIDGKAAADAFAAKLQAAPIRRTYRTSISSGLLFSAAQFGGGALLANHKMPHTTTVPYANLCTQPCGGQVPLLVLCVTAEEDEEVIRGNCVLRTGV